MSQWIELVRDLPAQIPGMYSHTVGAGEQMTARSWSAAVSTDFCTLNEINHYIAHPAHRPLIELTDPFTVEIATADIPLNDLTAL